eukprot:c23655_g1_i3 orf=144-1901(+)
MATAAFGLRVKVPLHSLHSPLSWCSGVSLWRYAQFPFGRQKQHVKDFHYHANGVVFLRIEGIPSHHQQELHCIKKVHMAKMVSLSVTHSEDLMFASSQQAQNHGLEASIQEFVHETARQSLLLASTAEEAGKVSGENAERESDLNTSSIAPLVYKRRSRRKLVAKQVSATKENLDIELKESAAAMAEDLPLEGQTEEAATKFTEIETAKSSRKRTVTPKASRKTDMEVATAVSRKRKVTAKTSQQKEVETVKGSKGRKGSARASQTVEIDMATGSERHDMDIVIKKLDPWLLLAHKKVQPEWSVYNPVTMRRANPPSNSLKLLSWNVNGLRALLKGKGDQQPGTAIMKLAEKEDFDVLSLQETKLQEKDALAIKEALLPGYDTSLWSCSTAKLGYSGTAVISRIKPLSVTYGLGNSNHDSEGRIITVEFDKFFLVTTYVPNSGQKLERLAYRTQDWDLSLANFLKNLEKRKPVILTGDLNCAHQEIDIYNPDGNRRSAGFTDEERGSFEKNFLQRGLNDTFRRQHPNSVAYTYWGYRTAARPKNQGWRLDYFLASDALLDLVHDSYILPDVEGSDHCPIGLTLKC